MNNSEKLKKSDRTKRRLLEAAIHSFSSRDMKDVSIAEIAREAELTPQGVYRYFPGKKELFFAALKFDLDSLHESVIAEMKLNPLAALTGACWYSYASHAKNHALAKKVIPTRQTEILDYIATLESTNEFKQAMLHDLLLAQTHGILRQDVDLVIGMESLHYLLTHVQLPLIFEDKYMGPEWHKVSYLMMGFGFHPIPDLSDPVKQKAFETMMAELIAKVLATESQPAQ